MLTETDYDEILRQFPNTIFAFAYGSGVMRQDGYNYGIRPAELPMLDLIFVVEDPVAWHEQNMALNPEHYSSILPLSSTLVKYFQDGFGAALWYNHVEDAKLSRFPRRSMKYGVISKDRLLEDLSRWTYLYAAGRLHKPVLILKQDAEIEEALRINRLNAVKVALLLMPSKFSELELYLKVASLSYEGDPRMIFGENPHKVTSIVTPIVPLFRSIYGAPLDSMASVVGLRRICSESFTYTQDKSDSTRAQLISSLPANLHKELQARYYARVSSRGSSSFIPSAEQVSSAIKAIVNRSSTSQSMKGLLTTGLIKCSVYLTAKLTKYFKVI